MSKFHHEGDSCPNCGKELDPLEACGCMDKENFYYPICGDNNIECKCGLQYKNCKKGVSMSKDPFAKRLETISGWIQTYTGKQFWPMDPNPDAISIIDIAVSLSRINRFTGHTREPYSVAHHSCLVCDILPQEYKKWGLMHDAHEAYVNDMVSPIKKFFPAYQEVETKLMKAVSHRFDLTWPVPKQVAEADHILLATEKRDIMGPSPTDWELLPKPAEFTIKEWNHEKSCKEFLKRFEKLFGSVKEYK